MSAVALAIVGKNNEPLFIQEFETTSTSFSDDQLFGLPAGARNSSLRQQFILHAALDRFEAISGPHPGYAWRDPNATGHDAMFAGLLCPVEELRVYGYMTTTQIRFLLTIKDDGTGLMSSDQKTGDEMVKRLFIKLHRSYVEYTLNPFSPLVGPIESSRFEQKVRDSVKAYNRAVNN